MSKHVPFALTGYVPVELRHRNDGWTPARQIDFLLALSESACVEDACQAVGKSVASVYALRRRIDGSSFRAAWEAALDYSIVRLRDAARSRALNGVGRPVFYKGEQIGERRYYDERLTMFILRLRDPFHFGSWRDRIAFAPEGDDRASLAEELIYQTEEQLERQSASDGPKPDSGDNVSSTSSTSR